VEVHGRDKPEDELLANCYRNALFLADENEIESIAFPAISTGAFGYPKKKLLKLLLKQLKKI
jgi:O-acetyl-ADP-ribose deacetylase (regulator of RNase III)